MASTSISISSQMETNRVETSRNWTELPPELTTSIMTRLGLFDLLNARKVCQMWHRICSDPTMWRVVDIRYSDDFNTFYNRLVSDYDSKMEKVAKKAVDLSRGNMIECTIERFGSDDLLRYVSDRSCQLRRLRLVSCSSITEEGLCEMLSKLPLLEELHLFSIPVSKQAIEVVGRCCPELKSFSLNRQNFRWPYYEFDEEALAIAANLPGLRHLQLLGNRMTSAGLMSIAENCLHLESLDIRQCFNVAYLEQDIERRLYQQIKNIRLPFDSTTDYEFGAEIYDSSEEYYPFGGSDIDTD